MTNMWPWKWFRTLKPAHVGDKRSAGKQDEASYESPGRLAREPLALLGSRTHQCLLIAWKEEYGPTV